MNIFPLSKFCLTFPNPKFGPDKGPLAYGGDLSVNRIMIGYSKGIFPWFNENDPILWWSPNPRFVLFLDQLHISKNLKKLIKKDIFKIKFNENFEAVIKNCAIKKRKDQTGSWITKSMQDAYIKLHKNGFAHSFEAYYDNKLVGGGYGVSIGDIFCGESMYTDMSGASNVAFVKLVNKLKRNGFKLIDSQIYTKHFENFGAKSISRDEYLFLVNKALENPKEFI